MPVALPRGIAWLMTDWATVAPDGAQAIERDPSRRGCEGWIVGLHRMAACAMGSHDFKCPAIADLGIR